ncbi:hypothetical protein PENVUL_c008G07214 [Penicillium vulpinum]|uniref:Glycoside hydrolase family 5 domain-containing protein n=1 Tax=Penicillium vulpinum TaxID=29845 RepID=A0A1V6S499_9EURO|nr:hypothetical protein PENVUL_c008G07214 [Penicillium vulpinum]
MLHTEGSGIVNEAGEVVILRAAAIGGFLNMENFITGYAGHEHEHRAQMAAVLGEKKAKFLFDRLLHHFFTNEDAAMFAGLGLNCIRIPFNYRQFFDDMDPDTFKPEGFAWLDRCVDICARHNIYAILELHALLGGQNQDWHCDSGTTRAAFWDFKDHQDRIIRFWQVLAGRYARNPVVAGHNPLNEPADPTLNSAGRPGARLLAWYARAEKAIRSVDPIICSSLTVILPNTVYAIHDYSKFGFPGEEQYTGTDTQKIRLRASFDRKVKNDGVEATKVNNAGRIALLEQQLSIYRETGVSWSIWLYKDIGYQGMAYVDPNSAYLRLIWPFLDKKQRLGLDCWTIVSREAVQSVYQPFLASIRDMVDPCFRTGRYPYQWTLERQFERVIREALLSEYVGWELAELFRDKTEDELEELAASFALKNCRTRDDLNETLRRDGAATIKLSK